MTRQIDAPRTDLRTQIDFLTEPDRPKIICLCGSTRFAEEMNFEAEQETLLGNIVVRPEVVAYHAGDDPQLNRPKVKADLDRLHLRKIDLSDEVTVVMVDGYIGESTRNEIAYAEKVGKTIKYADHVRAVAAAPQPRDAESDPAQLDYDRGLKAGYIAGQQEATQLRIRQRDTRARVNPRPAGDLPPANPPRPLASKPRCTECGAWEDEHFIGQPDHPFRAQPSATPAPTGFIPGMKVGTGGNVLPATPADSLDALRALSDAADEGPWSWDRIGGGRLRTTTRAIADLRYSHNAANADLIVAAVNYVRSLFRTEGSSKPPDEKP